MVKRLEDLITLQLAVDFKLSVYELVGRSAEANRDWKYKTQLFDAASGAERNVAEGWGRAEPGEMIQFFRYARGSIYESRRIVLDGVSRGYFSRADCQRVLLYADRCAGAVTNLWKSLEPFTKSKKPFRRPRRNP